jgi:hypothetical protein
MRKFQMSKSLPAVGRAGRQMINECQINSISKHFFFLLNFVI